MKISNCFLLATCLSSKPCSLPHTNQPVPAVPGRGRRACAQQPTPPRHRLSGSPGDRDAQHTPFAFALEGTCSSQNSAKLFTLLLSSPSTSTTTSIISPLPFTRFGRPRWRRHRHSLPPPSVVPSSTPQNRNVYPALGLADRLGCDTGRPVAGSAGQPEQQRFLLAVFPLVLTIIEISVTVAGIRRTSLQQARSTAAQHPRIRPRVRYPFSFRLQGVDLRRLLRTTCRPTA